MWKKVRCAAVGFRVPPSGRVKKCKSGFFREARVDKEMDHVTQGGRRAVSCGSNFPRPSHSIRGDAVHLRVMLGSARLGTTLGPTPKCPTLGKKTKKKTCPDCFCSLTQLYFTIFLMGPSADHSLHLNPSSRLTPLSPLSFHFFQPNFFPTLPLHQPPPHPSRHARIHLLSCLNILPVIVFLLALAGLIHNWFAAC